MQARHHEIRVGNFLRVCLRHFSSGAVRRFKCQGNLRQSHQQYRHEIGERPQPGPVNNEPIKDAPAGFKQGPEQVVAPRLSIRITAGQHISNSLNGLPRFKLIRTCSIAIQHPACWLVIRKRERAAAQGHRAFERAPPWCSPGRWRGCNGRRLIEIAMKSNLRTAIRANG
jgi:hypothetical protein